MYVCLYVLATTCKATKRTKLSCTAIPQAYKTAVESSVQTSKLATTCKKGAGAEMPPEITKSDLF